MKETRPDTFVDEIRAKVKCTLIRGHKENQGAGVYSLSGPLVLLFFDAFS